MTQPPKKPDFSNVQSKVSSTEQARADFSNVESGVTSTEAPLEGTGETAQEYTVVKGDTLSDIAKRFYGKAGKWPVIFDANRDTLKDPDRIRPGQVLRIPAPERSDD